MKRDPTASNIRQKHDAGLHQSQEKGRPSSAAHVDVIEQRRLPIDVDGLVIRICDRVAVTNRSLSASGKQIALRILLASIQLVAVWGTVLDCC